MDAGFHDQSHSATERLGNECFRDYPLAEKSAKLIFVPALFIPPVSNRWTDVLTSIETSSPPAQHSTTCEREERHRRQVVTLRNGLRLLSPLRGQAEEIRSP